MSGNIKERTGVLALGRYFGTVGIMLAISALPLVQARLGWVATGMLYVTLGTVLMLPALFSVKERNIVRPEKGIQLSDMIRFVTGNRYLLIFYFGLFFSNIANFAMTLSLFFPRYNLGNQELGTLLSMMTKIPVLLVGAFIPAIVKRIDKFHLFLGANVVVAVFYIARYFIGYDDLTVFLVLAFIQGIALGATNILMFMFTPDCLEYGTYHTGERSEGVAASVQTFFVKLTGGLSGPLAMIIISAFGFIEGDVSVQPESALHGIWLCMTLFPAIGLVTATLIWSRFKLRDKNVQIMAEYNSGRISKEEAEAQLGDKFGPAADLKKMTVTSA